MERKNIIIATLGILLVVGVTGFFLFQKDGAHAPIIAEKEEEGLGAEIFEKSQNPLINTALAANPFEAETNPFEARANPFEEETNPLKSFYTNPFQ